MSVTYAMYNEYQWRKRCWFIFKWDYRVLSMEVIPTKP
jgi:hypothetical protein